MIHVVASEKNGQKQRRNKTQKFLSRQPASCPLTFQFSYMYTYVSAMLHPTPRILDFGGCHIITRKKGAKGSSLALCWLYSLMLWLFDPALRLFGRSN